MNFSISRRSPDWEIRTIGEAKTARRRRVHISCIFYWVTVFRYTGILVRCF